MIKFKLFAPCLAITSKGRAKVFKNQTINKSDMTKMKPQNTPGPWNIDEKNEYIISVHSPWSNKVKPESTMTFGDYRGALICEMHYNSGVPTKEQALVNAKLIASAPEMLEALIAVNKYFIDLQNQCALTYPDKKAWKLTAEAIKKATA